MSSQSCGLILIFKTYVLYFDKIDQLLRCRRIVPRQGLDFFRIGAGGGGCEGSLNFVKSLKTRHLSKNILGAIEFRDFAESPLSPIALREKRRVPRNRDRAATRARVYCIFTNINIS